MLLVPSLEMGVVAAVPSSRHGHGLSSHGTDRDRGWSGGHWSPGSGGADMRASAGRVAAGRGWDGEKVGNVSRRQEREKRRPNLLSISEETGSESADVRKDRVTGITTCSSPPIAASARLAIPAAVLPVVLPAIQPASDSCIPEKEQPQAAFFPTWTSIHSHPTTTNHCMHPHVRATRETTAVAGNAVSS